MTASSCSSAPGTSSVRTPSVPGRRERQGRRLCSPMPRRLAKSSPPRWSHREPETPADRLCPASAAGCSAGRSPRCCAAPPGYRRTVRPSAAACAGTALAYSAGGARVGQQRAFADADARFVGVVFRFLEEAHVVGGDHRHIVLGGQRHGCVDIFASSGRDRCAAASR